MKAEIIKKDVLLITLKGITEYSQEKEISINKEYFNECRYFNGTYSIKKPEWTYYCKNKDYYCTLSYCLIIDIEQEEKATDDFLNSITNKFKNDIKSHKNSINILKNKIESINKIKHYENTKN